MATFMHNIYQVLYAKEQKLQQVRKEVEVLRIVLPLLEEDDAPANVIAAKPAVIPFESARVGSHRLPAALND
ncbi:MAG TPA: hypothetical protein VFU27_08080 [Terriglobales bacterium]|nr:hypothetical protein [Terriglobales bacterium]